MQRQWKPTKAWWKAYNLLHGKAQNNDEVMGNGVLTGIDEDKPIKNRKRSYEEQKDQFKVHAWLVQKSIWHHHSPNGGYRNAVEAAKFKRMGTSPGFPDLIIPYIRKGYGGLFVELKRKEGGTLSAYQKEWRDFLIKEGYAWYEAKGFDEVKRIVCDYLDVVE